MKFDATKAIVGDRVIRRDGVRGRIIDIMEGAGALAVVVRQDKGGVETYTFDGKINPNCSEPFLCFDDMQAPHRQPTMIPLTHSDFVPGKTLVRARGSKIPRLVVWVDQMAVSVMLGSSETRIFTFDELRQNWDISHDHGTTWRRAEKEGICSPPLDPLDEIDPSTGNMDKLTRRQVGEGKRIPAHDEPAPGSEDIWMNYGWEKRHASGEPYCRRSTYRVPIGTTNSCTDPRRK